MKKEIKVIRSSNKRDLTDSSIIFNNYIYDFQNYNLDTLIETDLISEFINVVDVIINRVERFENAINLFNNEYNVKYNDNGLSFETDEYIFNITYK